MKTMFKTIALCTSLTLALSACSPEDKKTDKVRITATEQMDAEELAQAGEQLVTPYTLHLANHVFTKALEKDPGNKKAQFYSAFLKRFTVFEGLLKRVRPYAEKYGNIEQLNRTIKDLPKHPLRDFLLKNNPEKGDIRNLADIQGLLMDYRDAIEEFRQFIAKNPDLTLELYLNPLLFQNQIEENKMNNCVVVDSKDTQTLADVECDFSEIALTRINIADLMVLKQVSAGEVLYYTLYTSYSVNGIDDLLKKNDEKEMTSEEMFTALEAIPGALTLNKRQSMTSVRKLGSDFGVALKWAMKYQESLCPRDANGNVQKRKGFLISDICVEDKQEANRTLATLEKVLAGTMKVELGENDQKLTKNINVITLFDKPVNDLRRLMPKTWNAEGTTATSFRDKTLGGLMPDGDADDLLKQSSN